MRQYLNIMNNIIEDGNNRGDRTGTGTRSLFGVVFRHDMKDGFPLLTSKKMATKQMLSELWWLMKGQTNIKPMVDENNYIWVGDAYKNYCKIVGSSEEPWTEVLFEDIENSRLRLFTRQEFIQAIKDDYVVNHYTDKKTFSQIFGELGPVYGKQWRHIDETVFDHLKAYERYLNSWDKDPFFPQNCNENVLIDESDKNAAPYYPYTFEEFYSILECGKDYDINLYTDETVFQHKFSKIYGNKRKIDQLQDAIDKIIWNPEDRRILVNSWNVAEISKMVLPPCHYNFQFYVEKLKMEDFFDLFRDNEIEYPNAGDYNTLVETAKKHNLPIQKVSLMWNQRSSDTALGKKSECSV